MVFAVIPVEGFEVEVELAEVFWSECADFEFDGDEAIQAAMKKRADRGQNPGRRPGGDARNR